MSINKKENILNAYIQLGQFLSLDAPELENIMARAERENAWFQFTEIKKSIEALAYMLNESDLKAWFKQISITDKPKKVGLILAGNIPMVGIHDVLSVLATGHIALIKLSSSDNVLIPFLLNKLVEFEDSLATQFMFVQRLQNFEAIIATGSNNSSRYFEYYFSKVPHIIRKNRNSVAVLTGEENEAQIRELGKDIFDYFGLGCRNVSKIYIPENYPIEKFFGPLQAYKAIIDNFKYQNNYDYNKSIYLVNLVEHFDNGFLLLKESSSLSSPLAVLHYEYYSDLESVEHLINNIQDEIQCVLAESPLNINKAVLNFGSSQKPKLWDYADNINTIEFLNNL